MKLDYTSIFLNFFVLKFVEPIFVLYLYQFGNDQTKNLIFELVNNLKSGKKVTKWVKIVIIGKKIWIILEYLSFEIRYILVCRKKLNYFLKTQFYKIVFIKSLI